MKLTMLILSTLFSLSALANDRCSIFIKPSSRTIERSDETVKYDQKLKKKLVKQGYEVVDSADNAALLAVVEYPACGIFYGDLCTDTFARVYIQDSATKKTLSLAEGRVESIVFLPSKTLTFTRALNDIKKCD
jgi:hypothetical protein